MTVEEGQAAILAKMKAERPTLRAYLKQRCAMSGKSSEEWKAAGSTENAAYGSGQWYAYRDIERMLENEEPVLRQPQGRDEDATAHAVERDLAKGLAGARHEEAMMVTLGAGVRLEPEFLTGRGF